jgi:hypothetical protein
MSAESDIRIIDKQSVMSGEPFLYKFIQLTMSGNGSHQSGFIFRILLAMIFDKPGQKGKKHRQFVRISWNDKEDTAADSSGMERAPEENTDLHDSERALSI